jgi:hypothetical protein
MSDVVAIVKVLDVRPLRTGAKVGIGNEIAACHIIKYGALKYPSLERYVKKIT